MPGAACLEISLGLGLAEVRERGGEAQSDLGGRHSQPREQLVQRPWGGSVPVGLRHPGETGVPEPGE